MSNFYIWWKNYWQVVSSLHFYLMCKSMAAPCPVGFLKKILTNWQIFVKFDNIFTVKILCYTVWCFDFLLITQAMEGVFLSTFKIQIPILCWLRYCIQAIVSTSKVELKLGFKIGRGFTYFKGLPGTSLPKSCTITNPYLCFTTLSLSHDCLCV